LPSNSKSRKDKSPIVNSDGTLLKYKPPAIRDLLPEMKLLVVKKVEK